MAMRLYTVHLGRAAAVEEAVLVREGFCWPALLLGPAWALWRGLWLWAAAWIAVALVLGVAGEAWPRASGHLGLLLLALHVLFAAEANDLRRRALGRRGWREAGVVGGPDRDTAARRYLDLTSIGAH